MESKGKTKMDELLNRARAMTEQELLALSDEEFNKIMEAAIEEEARTGAGAMAFEEWLDKQNFADVFIPLSGDA
jgi:hypothetical protein